ncbi:hypothetical protein GCM10008018_61230 [Paenibacillus marchantiophytorum]|uniref:Helix-turn-helix domain-containing protein n=1 Tax=Paenibacillus marchantiophytorum TaxID=1619310 RepID=A0ABQ1FDK3_9BACL|nr:hypothetical protein [Paenibacillus marchantiophytorum]GGA07149.1 hypothetical protein GCM10008018_61230 [Paenibacillus marchantiophytorum]
MTKKPWSTQELDKLVRLSSECPPVVIARELSRPVTSVRKKMREIGISYVTGEQWKKSQIQYLISDEGISYNHKHKLTQSSKENEFDSPVLDEFWTTLVKMARVAKKRGKKVDVLSFIDTYRKIRIGG